MIARQNDRVREQRPSDSAKGLRVLTCIFYYLISKEHHYVKGMIFEPGHRWDPSAFNFHYELRSFPNFHIHYRNTPRTRHFVQRAWRLKPEATTIICGKTDKTASENSDKICSLYLPPTMGLPLHTEAS